MNSKYQAVFLDLDGTLSESGEGIIFCVNSTMKDLNIIPPDGFEIASFIGPPLADSFRRCGLDEEMTMQAVKTYKSYYDTIGKFKNKAYDGIKDLLIKIKASGIKTAVATSKYEVFARQIVENIGLLPYFDFVAGASADASRQKKIDVLNFGIESIGASKETSLLVGDTRFDAEGARLCGCDFVGVLYGYGTKSEMENEGAKMFAQTAPEIAKFIFD